MHQNTPFLNDFFLGAQPLPCRPRPYLDGKLHLRVLCAAQRVGRASPR